MPDELVDLLEPTPRAPARARELVRALPADEETRRKVELIVSELVTNSVIHTGVSPTERLRLRLRCERSGVSGEVCDPGKGFDWENAEPDLSEPGGLGLMVVDQLALNWGVHRDGETCVWFECV
ncbi:MAG: ATP-binding protein [Actinomycetota bacterium]|nr:ATP-binding protein [Actinomycetota bacterium]